MPSLSTYKFLPATSEGQRPLSQIQNLPSNPSVSKDDVLVGLHATVKHNLLPDQKENIGLPKRKKQKIDNLASSRPSLIKLNPGKESVKKISIRTKKVWMTDAEKDLYTKLVNAKRKLSKYKNKSTKQSRELRTAKNIFSNPALLKVMEDMTNSAKVLTLLQFREHAKKEKGRRFHLKEKIIALTILKQSPKAYRFLRKIFVLPSPQTLVKLLSKANVQPGVNKKIFAQLKAKATTMKTNEKLCILLYDEMSLQANVTYNERRDKVNGFVTDGRETRCFLANHAQVFMVRGLIKNYKEPVSFTFSSGATKGPELAKQIKEIITELQNAGLKVLATVCDQGSNNRQAIKCLMTEARGSYLRRGETPKDNVFLVNDAEIVPLYDPPHLLKGIRNNLLSKNLQFEMDGRAKLAQWHHLELLHKENPGYKGIRLVPKLTDAHIIPNKIGKMKVKHASQVFSATVASNMGYLADKGILPKECKDTADLLMFIDKLFDSVNGSYTNKNRFAKPLLGPVTPKSCHHNSWNEAKKVLKTMSFVHASGKKEIVPTINNWVWTLEGIEVMLKKIDSEFNITSVWLRHLNQDPIENFFGAVRSHGWRNTNPTPEQFESAYTALLVNSLTSIHAPGGNCENDLGETLFTLVNDDGCEADNDAEDTVRETEVDINAILNIELETIESKKRNPKIFAPLQYISGYFVHKAKKIFKNCETCKNDLISVEQLEYLSYREYAGRRWLCSPSDSIINIISNLQDATMATLQNKLEVHNLKLYIKTVIDVVIDLKPISCGKHKAKLIDFLINKVTRFFIFTYCKNINKVLRGKKDVDDVQDKFENMAKVYYEKSLKKKK
ncbi:Uncharacterized protein OBRU01_25365 [Operophtera brumata]|uniref:Transposable element P transposase n=1 Tax=Operophtera brumata TaxID=104452 RepID=A0A0L7K5T4_OPEBR|nr:Uncharacterized protein OBRU01_25365 [Operophtera brumata]